MAASKRMMNVSGGGFTPAGGSLTAITGISTAGKEHNVEVVFGAGDADYFNSFGVAAGEDPSITINANQAALLDAIAPGSIGVLTFTLNDARNAATTSGGAKIYTISNAIYKGSSISANHRQLTTVGYQFATFSTDGATSPIAIAAA